MAVHLGRRAFSKLVRDAVAALPAPFRDRLDNVAVVVQDWPDERDLEVLGPDADPDELFGIHSPLPLVTNRGDGLREPVVVKVFRRPLLATCRSREELTMEVRATVAHELAHYFGFTEDDLAPFERDQERLRQERFGEE